MTTLTETSVAGNDDQREANDKMMIALDVDGTLVDHDGHMSVPSAKPPRPWWPPDTR